MTSLHCWPWISILVLEFHAQHFVEPCEYESSWIQCPCRTVYTLILYSLHLANSNVFPRRKRISFIHPYSFHLHNVRTNQKVSCLTMVFPSALYSSQKCFGISLKPNYFSSHLNSVFVRNKTLQVQFPEKIWIQKSERKVHLAQVFNQAKDTLAALKSQTFSWKDRLFFCNFLCLFAEALVKLRSKSVSNQSVEKVIVDSCK